MEKTILPIKKNDSLVLGVCCAIANCFKVDPTFIRIVLVLLYIFSGLSQQILVSYIFLGFFVVPSK